MWVWVMHDCGMWCVVPLIADKKEGGVLPTSTQQPVPSTPHNASIEIQEPWTAADAMLLWRSDIIHVIQNSIVLILSSIFIKHHQHPQTSIGVYQLIFMRLSLSTFEFEVLFIACMKNIVTCLPSLIFTFSWIHPHPKKKKCCHVSCWWCWVMLNYWNWNSLWSVSLSPGLHAESSTLFDRCISINPHAMRTSGQVMVVCIQLSDTPSTPHRALYIVYEYY